MHPVFIDFETYWDQDHSLSKLNPIEYVLSPKTELISLAVAENKDKPDVSFGEDAIRDRLARIDWSKAYAIAHNMSGFDSMLLAWRLGIRPKMWGCTLSMARAVLGKVCRISLESLVRRFNIGSKQAAILHSTRGKHLADFSHDEIEQMRTYNGDDTWQCRDVFYELLPNFTSDELWHIDCNIRMLVEAEFQLDTDLLRQALVDERKRKRAALLNLADVLQPDEAAIAEAAKLLRKLQKPDDKTNATLEWVRQQMASSGKFAQVLTARGVEVPLKRSKTDPNKKIPAIAKTDEAMEELLEHDDEVVAAAAEARLSVKSTQLETRIQSFLSTHKLVGKLPVPAHYCGADTTGRDSGWLYNMLNLPRIGKTPKISDALRKSVLAPEDKVMIVNDLSGIELRVNHTLWKVQRSMDLWAAKADADLYRSTASRYYKVAEDSVEPSQRQFAKVLELACGFGTGYRTFRRTARTLGGLNLTLTEAKAGVYGWRDLYPEIADRDTGGWAVCHEMLQNIADGVETAIDPWGLCHTIKDGIRLPSGRVIRYPNLRQEVLPRHYEQDDGTLQTKLETTWVYDDVKKRIYIYGGKVDENIVQALARDIIFGQAVQFFKDTGMRPKHKVYDELAYLALPEDAPGLLEHLQTVMRAPVKWWPELTLWCEGGIASRYGDAK